MADSRQSGEGAKVTPRYRTIAVDPPWRQKGGPLKGGHGEGFIGTAGSLDLPYSTMTLEEIKALPVALVADDDAHLYLWATNRYLPAAFDVIREWGFTYSTTLVWAKKPMGGGLGGAYGISTEYVLFARRGRLPTTARIRGTAFDWKRPYCKRGKPQHSAKPPEAYRMFAAVSPGPRLDMFARSRHVGWDAWGDEIDGVKLTPIEAIAA
jgi:N6-adenosine-specific RNA methylase IME4